MASFPLSGGVPKYADWVAAAGTVTELVNAIKDFLTTTTGGFSVIAGSSGDWQLRSTATPQGYRFGVRIRDQGSITARIYLGDSLNVLYTGIPLYLQAVAGRTYRMWSNGYSVFIWTPSSVAASAAVNFGTQYVETFNQAALAPPDVAWGGGAALYDGDNRVPAPSSFRTRLDHGLNGNPEPQPVGQIVTNGVANSANGGNMVGSPCLWVPGPGTETRGGSIFAVPKFADDSFWADAAWIGYDILGVMNGGVPKIVGRLYDAHVTCDPQPSDTVKTLNGYQWVNFTVQNQGSPGSHYGGTLWLRIS